MAIRSPSMETIRFITKILSVRETSVSELPGLIASIDSVFETLGRPVVAQAVVPVIDKQPKLKLRPPKPVAAPKIVTPKLLAPKPAKAQVVELVPEIVKRGRGRPRRIVESLPPVVAEVEHDVPELTPQSRLLRRSESRPQEPDLYPNGDEGPAVKLPPGPVRGVVKWFDGRTGKGVLRLTGVSGDVTLDMAALTRAGIKRLYKDQEIEASVEESHGRIRLVSLALPGRAAMPLNANDGENPPVKRATRSVMIEIKRDGNRQTAARAEAEQLFARPSKPKTPRRQTP